MLQSRTAPPTLTFFSVFRPSSLTMGCEDGDWLVSQEATLLFPLSSGMRGGLVSSVPRVDPLIPSLLSWLPGRGRSRRSHENQSPTHRFARNAGRPRAPAVVSSPSFSPLACLRVV